MAGETADLAVNGFTMQFRTRSPDRHHHHQRHPLRKNVAQSHRTGVELEGRGDPPRR